MLYDYIGKSYTYIWYEKLSFNYRVFLHSQKPYSDLIYFTRMINVSYELHQRPWHLTGKIFASICTKIIDEHWSKVFAYLEFYFWLPYCLATMVLFFAFFFLNSTSDKHHINESIKEQKPTNACNLSQSSNPSIFICKLVGVQIPPWLENTTSLNSIWMQRI